MKTKIIVLTPVYNDWKNLIKLLAKINNIFKIKIKTKFDLVVINDCSTESYNFKKLRLNRVNKLTLINLDTNVGSQSALAIGIKYISKKYKEKYNIVIIDSDGQDNPQGILKMYNLIKKNSKISIVVNRGQRKEPLWFRFFYSFYSAILFMFVGKKIRFGNFSLINSAHVKNISQDKDLWSAFPPTVSNNTDNISYITLDREKRFSGKSKMNFFGLIFHALRVFSVFRYRIIFSSMIYLFLNYVIFFKSNNLIIFLIFSLILLTFNLSNLVVYIINRLNFVINSKKIRVKIY